jgi:hypothetical protein
MKRILTWRLLLGSLALAALSFVPASTAKAEWTCSGYSCDSWGMCCSICVDIDGCGDIRAWQTNCF